MGTWMMYQKTLGFIVVPRTARHLNDKFRARN